MWSCRPFFCLLKPSENTHIFNLIFKADSRTNFLGEKSLIPHVVLSMVNLFDFKSYIIVNYTQQLALSFQKLFYRNYTQKLAKISWLSIPRLTNFNWDVEYWIFLMLYTTFTCPVRLKILNIKNSLGNNSLIWSNHVLVVLRFCWWI